MIDEDYVKKSMIIFLKNNGFKIDEVRTKHKQGPDIVTKEKKELGGKYIIECKGLPKSKSSHSSQKYNYLIYALGEIIFRMNSNKDRYGIALPNLESYKKKIKKIPPRILKSLDLDFFFVDDQGNINKTSSRDLLENWRNLIKNANW